MGVNTNGQFREDELVTRRMKVNGEWQERTFPVVGGRLRLAHEGNERLSIQTEIVSIGPDMVVAKATVETEKGRFNGTGTASAQRDQRLADALVELAETRAIARALRFGGFGVEYCSAEEVSHLSDTEPSSTANKSSEAAGGEETGKGPNQKLAQRCANYGRATTAQVRALHALTKKAQYSEEDIDRILFPLNAATFQELTREDASQLITALQSEAAA
jgi:hypothetical protein